jgi:hypothetical protein
LIPRQVRVFAERSESFEWKTHAHNLPSDLPRRLRLAGGLNARTRPSTHFFESQPESI